MNKTPNQEKHDQEDLNSYRTLGLTLLQLMGLLAAIGLVLYAILNYFF